MTETDQEARRHELAVTEDPRAARTRERIVDALGGILHDGAPVSVAAICARAGIARSTFYTHYSTVGDVVIFVVDEVLDELGRRDVLRRRDHEMARTAITELGIHEMLAGLAARRPFFVYAMSVPATERVRDRLLGEMAERLEGTIAVERPDAPESFVRTASEFIAGGMLGVLLGWMIDPSGRDEDALVATLVELLPSWLTS